MTQLREIKVNLSPNQKKTINTAHNKKETIIIRLSKDSLSGNDSLNVPTMIKKRLEKNRKNKKGMDIKLSKSNIRKQNVKVGGHAPQMGQPKPRPRRSPPKQASGMVIPYEALYGPPPFHGNWSYNPIGMGAVKPKLIKKKKIIKPQFHKNIPLSNYDLIKWCKYLNVPINNVLSRDESLPHNHKHALFVYNLEPSYLQGSHWVATYVKDNTINYFDSFGLPPFQEIVNHTKKKNFTLLHQNNQIQNINTTTCGYFCLYFLNEMNNGKSYFNLLQVFDIHNTMNNEKFIAQYFKNI